MSILERIRQSPYRIIAPNAVTLAAVMCGLSAVRYCFLGNWTSAALMIFLVGILDGIDGRTARFLRASSPIGVQLDSLSDFLNFGIIPALFAYFLCAESAPAETSAFSPYRLCWGAALFYAACAAFRLARFNVAAEEVSDETAAHTNCFTGLASPCAAGLVLLPFAAEQLFGIQNGLFRSPWVITPILAFTGAMMISKVPTPSIKGIKLFGASNLPAAGIGLGLIALLIASFWLALLVIGIGYLISIPICAIRCRKHKQS